MVMPPHVPGAGQNPDFQVRERIPEEIAPGVYAALGFGNSGWVVGERGVVVVDAGLGVGASQLREAIGSTSDRPIVGVIYTHGHHDHVLGTPALIESGTQVLAHESVARRFDRYKLTREHINRINTIQFGFDLTGLTYNYVYPTVTYSAELVFEAAGRRIELMHGMGETDDATVVHVPDAGIVFCGDFLIGSFPNIGNPYKVLRYEREWYETLERVRDLQPKAIMPGHGRVLRADGGLNEVLRDNIDVMRFLHEETVKQINAGLSVEQAVEQIRLPEALEQSPHLRQTYSRVEFAVTNIYRRYCGWFDYNPAHLLPVPRRDMAAIVSGLIGNDERVLARARELHEDSRHQEALELLDIVLLRKEDDRDARELRAGILEALAADDSCLMSRDAYLYYLKRDQEFLASTTVT